MIGLIDINTGNIASLSSALRKLNIKFKFCRKSQDFQGLKKFILPGVGAYKDFMNKLKRNKFDKIILEKVNKNCSFLGICAGYQVLFYESTEHGHHTGLNLIKGKFISFRDKKKKIKVPHVGWNECEIINNNNLFYNIPNNSDFYFTHTYILKNFDEDNVITKTNYHLDFVSSINYKNIYGVQFHPEKSQLNGLKLLKNFYERC